MRDMPDESSDLQVVIEDDDETPLEFVIDLVRSVFGQSDAQVRIFTRPSSATARRSAASIPRPSPKRSCRPAS
jgi:hypothetical protein